MRGDHERGDQQATTELRDAHPEIPRSLIVGMRNRLIHAYFDINLTILWETVNDELRSLMDSLRDMLEADR